MTGMKRIEAGLIRKAMAEPWEKLSFALTLNLLTLTISFFSGTLWLLFFASLIIDVLAGLEALVQKARARRFVRDLDLSESLPLCRQADNTFFLPNKLISWYRGKGLCVRYEQIKNCYLNQINENSRMKFDSRRRSWKLQINCRDKRYTVLALERKDDCMKMLRFLKTMNPAIVVYYEIPAKPLTLAELPEYE